MTLYLICALFAPKKYTVSVSQTINKPRKVVFDFVKTLKNQEKYSEWVMADPNLHPVIEGTDGTVGAIQMWNSANNNVGEGEQQITSLTKDRMDIEIRFKRPFKSTAKAANIFNAISEHQTQIISEYYSDEKYPLNLVSYIFGRKMIHDIQVKNLNNLKRILEKNEKI